LAGKPFLSEIRLDGGLAARVAVRLAHDAIERGLQTWIVGNEGSDFIAGVGDRQAPRMAAASRLKAPFEEMQEENREAARELALLGLAHALDFLREEVEIGLGEPALAQERRLFEAPGIKILIAA
jgi:MoxR-like ATPase